MVLFIRLEVCCGQTPQATLDSCVLEEGTPGPPRDGFLGAGEGTGTSECPRSNSLSQVWPIGSSPPKYFSDDSFDSFGWSSAPHTGGRMASELPSFLGFAGSLGGGRWALPGCSHSSLPGRRAMTRFPKDKAHGALPGTLTAVVITCWSSAAVRT